jgi:hypothetical protein
VVPEILRGYGARAPEILRNTDIYDVHVQKNRQTNQGQMKEGLSGMNNHRKTMLPESG